jgi:hypothetical protein
LTTAGKSVTRVAAVDARALAGKPLVVRTGAGAPTTAR